VGGPATRTIVGVVGGGGGAMGGGGVEGKGKGERKSKLSAQGSYLLYYITIKGWAGYKAAVQRALAAFRDSGRGGYLYIVRQGPSQPTQNWL
jgi:hypothetical protein